MSGVGKETAKTLAPSSWGGVLVWAVLAVVFISRPAETTAFTWSAVSGTGRWVAYTAFADCGEPPPMDWMGPKQCPAPVEPVTVEAETLEANPAPAPTPVVGSPGSVDPPLLADQTVVEVTQIHAVVEAVLEGGED